MNTVKESLRESLRLRRSGERTVLKLFKTAAARVPAYRDFLKKNRIRPQTITKIDDFEKVPPMTKENYLRAYPLEKLCWDGVVGPGVFAATSGSTGEPFYFPRNDILERQSATYHEQFLKNAGIKRQEPTLVIIGFGMGVWIGGLITYKAFQLLAQDGYSMTILAPGANAEEILEALRNLGKKFRHIVLCGYPPFLKDVVDQGLDIPWRALRPKFLFAAEAFSEEFRDYIAERTGMKDPTKDTTNIYGTADLGTMASESPLAISIRRRAVTRPDLFRSIFQEAHRLPTLAQFHPEYTHFEAPQGEILISGNSALPLIRYQIGDRGGVVPFAAMAEKLGKKSSDFAADEALRKLAASSVPWPFVFVYERSDLATKLYGAIIYPEHIRRGLLDKDAQKRLTGKFTIMTAKDSSQNQYLEVHMELRKSYLETKTFKKYVRDRIVGMLLQHNAEYKYLSGLMPGRVEPRLKFWEHGHPLHFKNNIKQKWVKK